MPSKIWLTDQYYVIYIVVVPINTKVFYVLNILRGSEGGALIQFPKYQYQLFV